MSFKPNPKAVPNWKAAIQELASVTKKENPQGLQRLALQSAKRFVKNIADVTPPASGKADPSAKKRGENAILGDLLKIAMPTTAAGVSRAKAKEIFASAEELMQAHARAVGGSSGRVNPRGRKHKLYVSQTTFNSVFKTLSSRVGWLAAGLNAAAAKLGFGLPAWIKRHGSKFGKISVVATRTGIRIRIIQNVPFADGVKGYKGRWEWAFGKEVRTLQRMVMAGYQRGAKRAQSRLR